MKLKEIYAGRTGKNPAISFEIFPPKGNNEDSEKKTEELFSELKILSRHNPSFISVTYGAGGGTREKTFELVLKIKNELNITPMPHFTCVGSSRSEILAYIKEIEKAKINNILALRGDPPKGEEKFTKPVDGFGYANELVSFIKDSVELGIAVAGYPECHQECDCIEKDIENLKRKVDSGADVIITQVFYDNVKFFDYVEKIRKAGITLPVIPGILPITNLSQIEKIVSMCSCSLPEGLKRSLKNNENDKEAIKELGIEYAVTQCRELTEFGVKGIHFYTLNKAYAVDRVLSELL